MPALKGWRGGGDLTVGGRRNQCDGHKQGLTVMCLNCSHRSTKKWTAALFTWTSFVCQRMKLEGFQGPQLQRIVSKWRKQTRTLSFFISYHKYMSGGKRKLLKINLKIQCVTALCKNLEPHFTSSHFASKKPNFVENFKVVLSISSPGFPEVFQSVSLGCFFTVWSGSFLWHLTYESFSD